jgi:hypothetical protein
VLWPSFTNMMDGWMDASFKCYDSLVDASEH